MKPAQAPLRIDSSWSLFLDRDGVINRRLIDDYVKRPSEFEFLPDVPTSLGVLRKLFGRMFVVTNQRGIARDLMTEEDLHRVHAAMLSQLELAGGKPDAIYYCPHDRDTGCLCRKPRTGMALQARREFPEIDFQKSVLIGDSVSDIEMGKRLGMVTVKIGEATGMENYRLDHLYEFPGLLG